MYFSMQKCKQTYCFEMLEVLSPCHFTEERNLFSLAIFFIFFIIIIFLINEYGTRKLIGTLPCLSFYNIHSEILPHPSYHPLSCQQILPSLSHTDKLPFSPCCFLKVCRFWGPSVVNSTSEIETIVLTKIMAWFIPGSRLFLFLMTLVLSAVLLGMFDVSEV